MKLESIAAAGDLLYDAIPLNGLMLMVGSLSPEQSPQREMRGSKTRQIVLTERKRFSQFQRTGQGSKMFAGKMGKRSARRLMKDQRLQPGVPQPAQKSFIPGLIPLR